MRNVKVAVISNGHMELKNCGRWVQIILSMGKCVRRYMGIKISSLVFLNVTCLISLQFFIYI